MYYHNPTEGNLYIITMPVQILVIFYQVVILHVSKLCSLYLVEILLVNINLHVPLFEQSLKVKLYSQQRYLYSMFFFVFSVRKLQAFSPYLCSLKQ